MDYKQRILTDLLQSYEKRKAYKKTAASLKAIQIDIGKKYPEYKNRYDHESYKAIHTAIERLRADGLIEANKNDVGHFTKIKLQIEHVEECYHALGQLSIPEKCKKVVAAIQPFEKSTSSLVQTIVAEWENKVINFEELPYNIKYDSIRAADILKALQGIFQLNKETYMRNFSTAIFKDSKKFKAKYKSTVENILFDNTEAIVKKEKILEYYNLYENPTYVLIKGNAEIYFQTSKIFLGEIQDGIALSNASLEDIKKIIIHAEKVITVENLTTYHDSDEADAVRIYLGGYHNASKQKLLEKIYSENINCQYYHKGDLDVYGFLILENLREKTKIPFEAMQMDLQTLKRFKSARLYKPLESSDRKIIQKKIGGQLEKYKEVLQFMIENNCKVEQESVKALELIEGR